MQDVKTLSIHSSQQFKKALVLGAGGFIGHHLVRRLKDEGYWITGVDLKKPEFSSTVADEFIIGDLRNYQVCNTVITTDIDEIYQLAADMGGAGYIFTGEHDADVMHNSATINLNVARIATEKGVHDIFYSSSACVYPKYNQEDLNKPTCSEESAYPAAPDSEYGWEKLFSERMYLAFNRNHGLRARIARFHNIFGPEGTWRGGREKAPAAICRKVAEAHNGEKLEIWGDGRQTRSFLYIDECLEGIRRLMQSDVAGPLNIGSEEMVSINQLVDLVCGIAGKNVIKIYDSNRPQGVRGRNSDNRLIYEKLNWKPDFPLQKGLEKTYHWIEQRVNDQKSDEKR